MSSRNPYKTDLSDEERRILEPLIPEAKPSGRPRPAPTRPANSWMPSSTRCGAVAPGGFFPTSARPGRPSTTNFRLWRIDGTWERLNGALRERLRAMAGREAMSGVAIVDSQSAKTTEKGGVRGYDGAKKVNGHKRHLLVDTTGLVMKAKAHPADVADCEGARLLLEPAVAAFARLGHLWADAGYRGAALREWVTEQLGLLLEIVQRRSRWVWVRNDVEPEPVPAGFEVIKRSWVVERSGAWIVRNRRMRRDYEFLAEPTETVVYV